MTIPVGWKQRGTPEGNQWHRRWDGPKAPTHPVVGAARPDSEVMFPPPRRLRLCRVSQCVCWTLVRRCVERW